MPSAAAVCCGVLLCALQCVAVCRNVCSVLQCVAECCSVANERLSISPKHPLPPLCVAVRVAVCCSVLQYVAVFAACCSVLQRVAAWPKSDCL